MLMWFITFNTYINVLSFLYSCFKLSNCFIFIWSSAGGGKLHSLHWNPVFKDKDASKATIIVYGEGQDIEAVINRLENLWHGDFDTKAFKDELIPVLSKTQVCYKLRVLYNCWMALRTMYMRISWLYYNYV